MMAGLLLKALGWPLRPIFTSAGQRHHTWITRYLIARMDSVIARAKPPRSYLKRPATVILHGIDTARYAPPPNRDAAFPYPGFREICDRMLRPRAASERHRRFRRGDVPPAAEISGLHRRHHRMVTPDQRAFNDGLKKQAAAAGLADRIRFLGELPIDDVPAWYQRILIYAFTSRNEGFGLTLLEAMASGAALVAARAGAADTVVVDGETGFLVPTGDANAMADAIERLMRDPARAMEMGRKARERVLSQFSVEAEATRSRLFIAMLSKAAG
jgi:mannosyltransferase